MNEKDINEFLYQRTLPVPDTVTASAEVKAIVERWAKGRGIKLPFKIEAPPESED